ncbi:MAG: hypothetical protein GOV15_00700, partial [Candidatus Diapherotrites archaeon]|nr:hypothetical protein [Candidatus Diapherotrites archaeon]
EIEEIFAQTPRKRLLENRNMLTAKQARRVERVLMRNLPMFHGRRPNEPFYKRTGIHEGTGFMHVEPPGIYHGPLGGIFRRLLKRRRLRGEKS